MLLAVDIGTKAVGVAILDGSNLELTRVIRPDKFLKRAERLYQVASILTQIRLSWPITCAVLEEPFFSAGLTDLPGYTALCQALGACQAVLGDIRCEQMTARRAREILSIPPGKSYAHEKMAEANPKLAALSPDELDAVILGLAARSAGLFKR